jgi:hypothetical protein
MKLNFLKSCCTLSLIFILYACYINKLEESLITHINIAGSLNKFQKLYLSEFTDSIWYVPLESRHDNPLNWNSGVIFDSSGEFIFDSNGRECFLYDKYGRFVREIGKQGRGPGEFMGISSISVIGDKIYIHDFYTDDLIEYNIDGTFLKRYKSGYTADENYRLEYGDAILLNDSMIFGNIENRLGSEEYKALIIDKQGHIKYFYKNYIIFPLAPDVKSVKVPGRPIIYKFGGGVFFKELLNDTLFRLNNRYRLIPEYIFDFGKYKQPLSERGKNWDFNKLDSYITLWKIFDIGNFLILECNFNGYFPAKRLTPETIKIPGQDDIIAWYHTKMVLGIYSKKTKDLSFSEPTSTDNRLFTTGFYNDVDAGPRLMPDKIINDSTVVMKIRFDHLFKHINSIDFLNNPSKHPERKRRLEMLVDSLQNAGFDNPVYMFCIFKR